MLDDFDGSTELAACKTLGIPRMRKQHRIYSHTQPLLRSQDGKRQRSVLLLACE